MPVRDFRRVAIVNRGEPAMRLINAVREFNHERGTDLKTIALYTEPDACAMFVREADEAYSLGSVTFRDDADGQIKNRYLDYAALERALRETGAEAAWVGWGFVAEHARFADLCDNLGVTFIGPPGDVIRQLGDKITSKKLAETARVPVAPWSGGPVETIDEALKWGRKLEYPLVLKATAGGGGRGIRKLQSEEELAPAFESAKNEALRAFGDGTMFMEKMVTGARHIEVQLIADHYGTVWPLGIRDCSLQRNNQKVVEESSSTELRPEQENELKAAAARLGATVGYRNAGTVEFLYDPSEERFSFMEVNARLQVEHPVTELTTGADLVKMQIAMAMGESLEGNPPPATGHAVEVRLCAEDPATGFMPAPGRIERFRVPAGPGVRVDTGFEEGDEISPQFDSMIAKIITYGRDRREALARMGRVLEVSTVIINGGTSNRGFLMELLRRPDVVRGHFDIGYLDRLVKQGDHVSRRHADVAIIQAALDAYEQQLSDEQAQFFDFAARGRPEVSDEIGRSVELGYDGQAYECDVFKIGADAYRIETTGAQISARIEAPGGDYRRLIINDRRYRILSVLQGTSYIVEVEGVPHRVLADSGRVVRAPAPSVVVKVVVKVGDQVEIGDRLVVLEAMKTETTLTATFAGTVRQIMAQGNEQVGPGAPLLQVDPPADAEASGAERVAFCALEVKPRPFNDPAKQTMQGLERLRCLMLGYDVVDADVERTLQDTARLADRMTWSTEVTRSENAILRAFVDLANVFDRKPPVLERRPVGPRLSNEQALFSYLVDLDIESEALPSGFGPL
ncbi:MAG: biotin carboxylase N-terminal domain-containing protein, partial [Myxococcota bacterium]